MAEAKRDLFAANEQRTAELAKALAHPVRVRIVKILAEEDTCICGSLVDRLPLSQSTVSQHLKELKSCGLIQGTIQGPRICYCLNPEVVEEAGGLLAGLLAAKRGVGCVSTV